MRNQCIVTWSQWKNNLGIWGGCCLSTCFILVFINLCLLTNKMQIMRVSALLCCGEKPQHIKHVKFLEICLGHSKWSEVKWSESRSVMSDSLWSHGLFSPWNSPVQNTGVSSFSLLQGIFLTQELNRGLLHCRWILYQLSYHYKIGSRECTRLRN